MIRALVLLLLLSCLGWGLSVEQGKGRFRAVDETFLDFLLANARGRLKPDPAKLGDVVFVRLREEDRKEYEAWPPHPSDYLMVLNGLAPFEPAVLVIADPLNWPEPKPESIPALAQAMLPIPSVVLAAEAGETTPADAASITFASDHMAALANIGGQTQMLAEMPSLVRLPEPALVPQKEIGVLTHPQLSFALKVEDHAVPSLALAAISAATRTPYASQRLHSGPGAGVHLGADHFVPLENNGSLKSVAVSVPSVNGLDLMTASIVDGEADLAKVLGKGKTIVVGIDNDGPEATSARTQAQAIAGALAMPAVNGLGGWGQFLMAVLAALAGVSLLLLPKQKAAWRTFGLLFGVLLVGYLMFEAFLVWFPPTVPAGVIVGAGLFARFFGFDPSKPKNRRSGKFYSLR